MHPATLLNSLISSNKFLCVCIPENFVYRRLCHRQLLLILLHVSCGFSRMQVWPRCPLLGSAGSVLGCEDLTLRKGRSGLAFSCWKTIFTLDRAPFVCLGALGHTGTIWLRVGALHHTVSVNPGKTGVNTAVNHSGLWNETPIKTLSAEVWVTFSDWHYSMGTAAYWCWKTNFAPYLLF